MQLETRLSKLEKQRGIGGAILAIITVPQDSEDLFEDAKLFWEKEKAKYPQVNATYALPLPCYSGTETKFVGIGTYDDYYFLLCWGVRDTEKCKFIFLNEVEQSIKLHWKELSPSFLPVVM